MSKYGIILSKENMELSVAETKTIMQKFQNAYDFKIDENLLLFESDKSPIKSLNRLAYAKSAHKIINPKCIKIQKSVESYKIEKFKLGKKPIDIMPFLHEIKKIKLLNTVKMNDPDIIFSIISCESEYFGTQIWKNKENFGARKGNLRPEPHPTTMDPKLARALVNLAGAKKELTDPFCGAGGILIEAGLIGLKISGYDIDSVMIKRAEINLKYFNIKKFTLKTTDALKVNKKTECIATDVPYGKSSILKNDLNYLISNFLENYRHLTSKIVLVCPANAKFSTKTWKVEHDFRMYIHKTLTRRILVLS